MYKLSHIQCFFHGAFEAFSKNPYTEDESFAMAYELTKTHYSKQPIYRSNLVEFTKWYQSIQVQEPDCDNDGSNNSHP